MDVLCDCCARRLCLLGLSSAIRARLNRRFFLPASYWKDGTIVRGMPSVEYLADWFICARRVLPQRHYRAFLDWLDGRPVLKHERSKFHLVYGFQALLGNAAVHYGLLPSEYFGVKWIRHGIYGVCAAA